MVASILWDVHLSRLGTIQQKMSDRTLRRPVSEFCCLFWALRSSLGTSMLFQALTVTTIKNSTFHKLAPMAWPVRVIVDSGK